MAQNDQDMELTVVRALVSLPLSVDEVLEVIELDVRTLMVDHDLDHVQAGCVKAWGECELKRHRQQLSLRAHGMPDAAPGESGLSAELTDD